MTDGQSEEQVPFGDGTSPVRLVDVMAGTSRNVVRILNTPPFLGPRREFRVVVHPAWDRSYTRIAFQGCPEGTRQVFVADLASEIR